MSSVSTSDLSITTRRTLTIENRFCHAAREEGPGPRDQRVRQLQRPRRPARISKAQGLRALRPRLLLWPPLPTGTLARGPQEVLPDPSRARAVRSPARSRERRRQRRWWRGVNLKRLRRRVHHLPGLLILIPHLYAPVLAHLPRGVRRWAAVVRRELL